MNEKHVPVQKEAQGELPAESRPNPMQGLQRRINEMFDEFRGGFQMPSLQRRINDMFDDLWGGFQMPALTWPGGFTPKINVQEDENGIRVKAELPGLDEKDIEVTLTDDGLTISGEKKSEQEEKGKSFIRREMSYGSFRRTIPLPAPVQADKVKATFKNGVLDVELPVPESARRQVKKIAVKGG